MYQICVFLFDVFKFGSIIVNFFFLVFFVGNDVGFFGLGYGWEMFLDILGFFEEENGWKVCCRIKFGEEKYYQGFSDDEDFMVKLSFDD